MNNTAYVFKPIWYIKDEKWTTGWIGPLQNLHPEPRKHLSGIDKNNLMRRQNGKCNGCSMNISLYPYPNCDIDHIIPISLGGKTTINNAQALCVTCHRHKTALENRGSVSRIWMNDCPEEYVYVITNTCRKIDTDDFHENILPIDAIKSESSGIYIVMYNNKHPKMDVIVEKNFVEFLDKFKYIPN